MGPGVHVRRPGTTMPYRFYSHVESFWKLCMVLEAFNSLLILHTRGLNAVINPKGRCHCDEALIPESKSYADNINHIRVRSEVVT
jgi:hypothetical protein